MNGHYKDREPSEIEPLAKELYDSLKWFFSDENVKVNIEPYNDWAKRNGKTELHHNKIAYINAYVDLNKGKYMVIDSPTCDKRGCSFWGYIKKFMWNKMIPAGRMRYCTEVAKSILHLQD